jgi:MFS family permease
MLLFYPAGWIMDRFGRVWVAVPVVGGFAVCLIALPLTSTVTGLGVCLAGMAIGNGLGSGIVMTLGADAAPANGRAAFLGVWRLSSLIGVNGAALLVASISGLVGLGAASIVLGVLCALGALWLGHWVPRYDPRRGHGIPPPGRE